MCNASAKIAHSSGASQPKVPGVGRVSFGPQSLGLTLHHLAAAAAQLTARGEYPAELAFRYEL